VFIIKWIFSIVQLVVVIVVPGLGLYLSLGVRTEERNWSFRQ